VAVRRRRLETKAFLQPIKELLRGHFGNAYRAVALYVGVAAHRAQARAVLADIAFQKTQIGELLDIVGAVLSSGP
jgi:hypothetical protein